MRNPSRFIPGEEIDAVEQWQFGSIDTTAHLLAARIKAHEDEEAAVQTESQMQQVYQDGYAAGLAQGKQLVQAQAQAQAQEQIQVFQRQHEQESADKLAALFASAQRELQAAEQAMAQGVLALSCELARQMLRHELRINAEVVMPVLNEAIGLLGSEFKSAVVKMNPLDIAALGEQIQTNFAGLGVSLRADPEVLPGGCLVESAGTVVDGTVQKRWQRTVATLGLSSSWEVPVEPVEPD